jgi:hypothetical protein
MSKKLTPEQIEDCAYHMASLANPDWLDTNGEMSIWRLIIRPDYAPFPSKYVVPNATDRKAIFKRTFEHLNDLTKLIASLAEMNPTEQDTKLQHALASRKEIDEYLQERDEDEEEYAEVE